MLATGERPRELRWYHAGPMLFGDWGTSRLYVLGLAFAFNGRAAFWFIALMSVLLIGVGWSYEVICRLFPDGGNPEWLPPTVVGTYATMREQDRKLRVNEAMDEAAKVVGDDEAATARLDDYELRNAVPDESIAGNIKLGNTVGIETAGQLHELTQLAAEANQLEADQRLQEDWERQQHNLYLHTSLRNGYWIGRKSWDVDQLATAR